ncbi:MAG: DUF1501 domain-containing protein [Planctomycetota bacterium]
MSLTRRSFISVCGTAVVTTGLFPIGRLLGQDTPGSAPAPAPAPVTKGKTLVLIFQRGGADGLNMVAPFGEAAYTTYRPSIALKAPTAGGDEAAKALDLDGFFGLHPRMRALHRYFGAGELAIVHAVGNPKNNRSHFNQQDVWETCRFDSLNTADGWLNRHLQTSEGHGPLRAVAVGQTLPRILRGTATAQAIRSVKDLNYNNRFGNNDDIARRLAERYGANGSTPPAADDNVVRDAGKATLEGMKALEDVAKRDYTPAEGANYPERNGIADRLRSVAQLIKAGVGLEVAVVDAGGWDTHQNQGDAGAGQFADRVGEMADAMAAFARDMGDGMRDVLVLTMTEFGRTAKQNGTSGTDHGHGSVMLALGGPVAAVKSGGRVHGLWPGMETEQLNQKRDLAVTTDFRDVVTEVVTAHLGNTSLTSIVPDHVPAPVGLLLPGEDF